MVEFSVRPPSDFYSHRNMSQRTIDKVKEAEHYVEAFKNKLQSGKAHVSALPYEFHKPQDAMSSLVSSEDIRRLINDDLLVSTGPHSVEINDDRYEEERSRMETKNPSISTNESFRRLQAHEEMNAYLQAAEKSLTEQWYPLHTTFDASNSGKYPVRNIFGEQMHVDMATFPKLDSSERETYDQAMPFFDPSNSAEKLAELNHDKLYHDIFREEDVQEPCEKAMIGKDGATRFTRDLPENTAVASVGGFYLQENQKEYVYNLNDYKGGRIPGKYVIHLNSKVWKREMPINFREAPYIFEAIDPDTITKFANTHWSTDTDGNPLAQKETGYNMELRTFPVNLQPPARVPESEVLLMYTTRNVKKDEEARWDYGYDPFAIRRLTGQETDVNTHEVDRSSSEGSEFAGPSIKSGMKSIHNELEDLHLDQM